MEESSSQTVVISDPTTTWCRSCNLSQTTTDIWVLTPDGMYKAGYGKDCGCYR